MKFAICYIIGIIVLIASICVPSIIFGTTEYDCLAHANKNDILNLYQLSGNNVKVWINSVREIEPGAYHLSLRAREINGENHIDNFLELLDLKFYRLD